MSADLLIPSPNGEVAENHPDRITTLTAEYPYQTA